MASPWEQKWNEMKQGVEEVVGNASETLQNALPWARDWKAKATPQQAPAAPPEAPKSLTVDDIMPRLIQAESRGVHMDEKGVLTTSPVGAQGITQLMPSTAAKPGYGIAPVKDKSEAEYLRVGKAYLQKMYEKFGDWEKALAAYNAGVGNVMKAEGKAERFGGDWKDHLPKKDETLPYIKKIMQPKDMKPISSLKGQQLAATDVKMPRALEAAGEFAQAAGEGVQDAALAMGAGVNTSSALATAGEMLADPLNLIPGGKGVAGAAAVIKVGGKKITETMTDATFASILHSITGNPDDITKVIKGKKLSSDEREQMLLEALQAKKVGAESTVVNSSFIPSKYIKTPYDPKTGYSSELNNPIHLGADAPPGLAGARLSGFTDPNNKYFHGYDKNGEKFTIEASRVNPDWITTSKDGNKTAEYFRERLKGK